MTETFGFIFVEIYILASIGFLVLLFDDFRVLERSGGAFHGVVLISALVELLIMAVVLWLGSIGGTIEGTFWSTVFFPIALTAFLLVSIMGIVFLVHGWHEGIPYRRAIAYQIAIYHGVPRSLFKLFHLAMIPLIASISFVILTLGFGSIYTLYNLDITYQASLLIINRYIFIVSGILVALIFVVFLIATIIQMFTHRF